MFGSVGIPELIILGIFSLFPIAIGLVVWMIWSRRKTAHEFGYESLGAYLRAAPRTDQERKDAADLALKGAVMCLLGLLFPPLLLVGLFPFFYGARKLVYASMGLGLLDDDDRTHFGA
jgi:uncharacterized iron-regulated membrane protein